MSSLPPNTMEPTDQVPELPGGPAIAGHYINAVLHNPHHHLDDSQNVPPSPTAPHRHEDADHGRNPPTSYPSDTQARAANRARSGSTASQVPFDFFDREGIQQLKRSLTSQSQALVQAVDRANSSQAPPLPSNSSQATAVSGDDSFNLEKYLRAIVSKRDALSIEARQLGVVFQDLTVQGLGTSASFQETLGSTLNPVRIWENLKSMRHPPVRDILTGFEGVVKPGEMLLVLGRPGAGCTTLLKSLSNQHESFHAINGHVQYGAFTPKEIRQHYRGDVVYCPEDDVHFPTLTVGETIEFAARTRAPHTRFPKSVVDGECNVDEDVDVEKAAAEGGPRASRGMYVKAITQMLTTVFGLRHTVDTKVGGAALRGVSGGEKKRVSIAEALASRALLGSWDNSTRGLDASTALEFVRALRIATDTLQLTTVVSIYQAGESLYELFDKVCVISADGTNGNGGRMVYFGDAKRARVYFEDMGYQAMNRQTTPDFLVSVTDPNGRTTRPGYERRAPRNADEMAAYFQRSEIARDVHNEIEEYFEEHGDRRRHRRADKRSSKRFSTLSALSTKKSGNGDVVVGDLDPGYDEKDERAMNNMTNKLETYKRSARAERAKRTRKGSPYTISVPMQVRAVMDRRVKILRGDWVAQVIQLASYIFQGIIMGTVFLKVQDSTAAYFSRGGVLFFALLFGALSAMAEIPALYAQRPIVHRHQQAAMYHPFAEALALTIVDIPITFITMLIFSVILYFLVQLQQTASQFFIFFLFIFATTITMKAFFRALAAAFTTQSSAQSLAGVMILALALYTGYTIPQPSMIGALRWITYLNPLRYGFESILINEFHTLNGECATLVPSGPGYEGVSLSNQVCTAVGSVPGQSTVNGETFANLSYGYSYSHLWRNFGIVIAFGVGFISLLLLFTEINTNSESDNPVTLFKRGSRPPAVVAPQAGADDEENGSQHTNGDNEAESEEDKEEKRKALESQPAMTDIFSWQGVTYTVPVGSGETRRLLDNVSGFVAPGKLTALMGESGAGKTTLLNVLAQRTSTGVVTGDRFVNGHPLPRDFQAQTGYCQQMDTHLAETTVREALLFSAKMRQPQSVPIAEKEAYVETCLKMCGLEAYADAIVGTLGVEHKKRTTIGVELAAKPKLLLFLDEPTSGLDSQSAWAIMNFLRSLADHGQAILCTIHQPSAELFQIFDRLLLLRKGGQEVYFGDIGENSHTMIDYFERNGARNCGAEENPAEWMLEVIGAGATANSSIDWHNTWKKSTEKSNVDAHIDEIHAEGRKKPPVQTERHSEFATSWFNQAYLLLDRAFRAYWRNPTYLMAKLILNIAAGLFIGFTFFKAKDSIQGTQNKLFAIFMATILSVPLSNQLQVIFIDFRNVYEIRERPSRMYSWTALLTSQLIVELPWNILGSSIFFLCWYWTVGFESSRGGYTYLAYGICFPLYYTTIAQAVAAMSPDAVIAAILFSTLYSFVIAFNGVLQPFRQLGWWQWMYYVSPFTYLIEGMLGQAVGRMEINCADKELVPLTPPSGQSCGTYMETFINNAGGYLTNPDATSDCMYCSARTTDQFLLSSFNIHYEHRWRNIGVVLAFTVLNVIAIFVFTYIFRIRTESIFTSLKRKLTRGKNTEKK